MSLHTYKRGATRSICTVSSNGCLQSQVSSSFSSKTTRKMKTMIVCAMLLALAAAAPKSYETLNDNFDFSKLTTEQIGGVALCFLDQAPCNDLLNSYKRNYAIAIKETCAYCNESQKKIARVYFGRLAGELPDVYEVLKNRFDPQGIYFEKFLTALNQ